MTDHGRVPGPETIPGVAEAIRDGYVPLESLMGTVEFGQAWPADARRSFADVRYVLNPDLIDEDLSTLWMVRSPWPEISVNDVVALLWNFIERQQRTWIVDQVRRQSRTSKLEQVRAFFAQDYKDVRRRLPRNRR